MALIRLLFYTAAIYLFFVVAFPQWEGQVYHVASLAIIAGGAVAVFILLTLVDVSSTMVKIAIELSFAAAVALYFGYTMPQKSGKPPIQMWVEGHHPTQSEAREGLSRLGVNPSSRGAQWALKLFPKN